MAHPPNGSPAERGLQPGLPAAVRQRHQLQSLRAIGQRQQRPHALGDPRERLLTAMSETNDGLILAGATPDLPPATAARLVRDLPDEPSETEPPTAAAEPFAADVARLRAIARAYRNLEGTPAPEAAGP